MSIYIKPYGCAAEEPNEETYPVAECKSCGAEWYLLHEDEKWQCDDSGAEFQFCPVTDDCPVCRAQKAKFDRKLEFVLEHIYNDYEDGMERTYLAIIKDMVEGCDEPTKPYEIHNGGLVEGVGKAMFDAILQKDKRGVEEFVDYCVEDAFADFTLFNEGEL